MKKVLITVVGVTFLIFIIFLLIGSLFTDKFVDEEIAKLKSIKEQTKTIAEADSLASLPIVLKKYFGYAFNDSSALPGFVKINLTGEFKTAENADWQEVTAEQYYSAAKPAYVWNAQIKRNEFVWARAVETYSNGTGNILIKLFSSVKISDAVGEAVDQSGLTRYLCEAVFYPNFLLPDSTLKWEFIDQGKVKAVLKKDNLKTEVDFYFNAKGEISKIETMDRYRTIPTGYKRTLFSITFSDYKTFGSYKIPTYFETNWHTKDGKFTFGKFRVANAEYDLKD